MTDRIRAQVWLIVLLPIAIVAALVFFLWPAKKETKTTPVREEPSSTAVALPPPEIVSIEPPPEQPDSSAPPIASAPPVAIVVDASGPFEKIPELQAFFNDQPDQDEWTPEQKRAWRAKLFANIDAKERRLEGEIAFAESRGDDEVAAQKRATLAYLRKEKAKLQAFRP